MFRCDTGDHLLLSLPIAGGVANYKRAFFFNIPQKQHFFTMEIKEFFCYDTDKEIIGVNSNCTEFSDVIFWKQVIFFNVHIFQ